MWGSPIARLAVTPDYLQLSADLCGKIWPASIQVLGNDVPQFLRILVWLCDLLCPRNISNQDAERVARMLAAFPVHTFLPPRTRASL